MAACRETADPAPSQTPVGADSISARFAAAQGSAGGPWPSLTNHGERPANGKGTRPRAAVGRDALIPPHPAAAGTPAGGINPSPTNHEGAAAKRASRGPAVISDLCRGRCSHCARRRVSEANRATGPALRPEIAPRGLWRCKVPREGHGPPLQTMANTGPNGKGTRPSGGRRAGCPHPAAPRGDANACGRIWNPPLRPTAGPRPTGENAALRLYRTSVGDDACTAPAGAFRRPTGPQARLLGRRSSRGACGGARFRGRAMALPYKPWRTPGQTGRAHAPRAAVGRDALIPPHPAAAGTFPVLNFDGAGGRERPPYGPGPTWRPDGKPQALRRHKPL